MSKLREKLLRIQMELKAPKGQYNSFGKYNYRSCEDILEGVKPLLKEENVVLILSDDLVQVGERYYVKAVASIYDEDGDVISNSAYAREEENKKGMDGSQVTGASSSYARKYALNGLFLIDDVKDSDTTNVGDDDVENITLDNAKEYRFSYGKYKDVLMEDVIENDNQYVQWFLNNRGTDYDKRCYELLTGEKLPTQEELKERLDLQVTFDNLLITTKTDREKIYAHYEVEKEDDLTNEQMQEAIDTMKKKVK